MCVARYFSQHSDGRYLCYLWNKFKYLAMQISCHKDLILKKCVFLKKLHYTVELVTNHYQQGIVEWPLETGWPLYTGSSELGFFFSYKLTH